VRSFLRAGLIIIPFAALAAAGCLSRKEPEEPPIITSATYQHTLYNGRPQPIEAQAAKGDAPPFIITYFASEESLLKNEGGSAEAPGEVGDYFVRIERPGGNGYKQGPSIKVEYHIQKALVIINAEERQEFVYDGKPKIAAASADAPVKLDITYYVVYKNSNTIIDNSNTVGLNSNTALMSIGGPPVERGQYRALVSFAGNERYMGASKEIELVIR
jgi:hypothetical protein